MLNKKIPTIFGLLFLLVTIVVAVAGLPAARRFLSLANPSRLPENLRLTNISESAFVVSYLTGEPAVGTVTLDSGQVFPDDRDRESSTPQPYLTHYIPVTGLKPATRYVFKIAGSEEKLEVTTAPVSPTTARSADPIYGTVSRADGTAAAGAIVYLTSTNIAPLSALVKNNGNFILPVNNLRAVDLSGYVALAANDPETIFITAGRDGETTISCFVGQDNPLPNVILGKNISCRGSAESSLRPTGFTSPRQLELISPQEGGQVTTGLPTFRGTGPAEKVIQIEVHSGQPVLGSVKSDAAGAWAWTPPANLSPGEHTATISFLDENGILQKITRNFVVEAAGNQNIFPITTATPSAPLAPPPPAPSLTLPPEAGSIRETLFLLTAGIFLVTLGGVIIKRAIVI